MAKQQAETASSAASEVAGAELGDQRLNKRLGKIVEALQERPDVGFPKALVTEAELEGFYRFLSNEKVSFESLLAPHVQATLGRMGGHELVLVVHDTTEFRFSGEVERAGLGRLQSSGHGFLGHFALAMSSEGRRDALGVLGVEAWARRGTTATKRRSRKEVTYQQTRELETEQARWGRLVDEVEARVDGANALVHVMDSEADDYALLAQLVGNQQRFVVRLCYDRCLDIEQSGAGPYRKTKEFVAAGQEVCTRTVSVSARQRRPSGRRQKRHVKREARVATVSISASTVVFRRPSYGGDTLAKSLPVHVVHVREQDPPADVEPVEWLLITTEPIDTEEQILQVVDHYRARWVIEEYFKALKTGCAYEKRQLESWTTLLNALAIFIPIAWNLLRMRTLARTEPTAAARTVLTSTQLEVLRLETARRTPKKPLPEHPTVRDALLAVARLGGHLPRNGEPGWQVLGRGYHELLMLESGFRLARQHQPS